MKQEVGKIEFINWGVTLQILSNRTDALELAMQKLKNEITSNLDLKVDWVDGRAEWGEFELKLFDFKNGDCQWEIFCKDRRVDTDVCDNQKLAQAACVDALKGIVTGVKEK